MSKNIQILFTSDYSDCETCCGTYDDAVQITYNGKTYGRTAVARCFGNEPADYQTVMQEFLVDQGYTIEIIEEDYEEGQ